MACSTSSSKDNVEVESSEITQCDFEHIQRKAILDNLENLYKNFEKDLFDMKNNVSRESEEEEIEEVSQNECATLPGIKFFSQESNCDYDQNSIKAELSEFKHCSELDLESLNKLKEKILYEYIIENSSHKEHPFGAFMKLLFTSQSLEYLRVTSEILILYLGRTSKVYSFLEIIVSTLPIGLKNIGGNVFSIFNTEKYNVSSKNKPEKVKNFNPVENIYCVVDVLLHSLRKAKVQLKGELKMPDSTVDDLIFTLLTISQDPQILSSMVIGLVQNCLAELLDIYPLDSQYEKKIQDIVERVLLYWQDSSEDFDHVTAYTLCVNVIPLSRRGKQLKASLAFSSLNFCLPSIELSILDRVTLYRLSKFCHENLDKFILLDCKTLYSVLRLIHATIARPVNVNQDVENLKSLIQTITSICSSKSSSFGKEEIHLTSKYLCLTREITMQLKTLITGCPELAENLY